MTSSGRGQRDSDYDTAKCRWCGLTYSTHAGHGMVDCRDHLRAKIAHLEQELVQVRGAAVAAEETLLEVSKAIRAYES